MRYSLTFLEPEYSQLIEHLFKDASTERAAYLLCRPSSGSEDSRLLVQEVIPVMPNELESASATSLSIPSTSFMRALKKANNTKRSFVFVHSHPETTPNFSTQDDKEEQKLFRTTYNRITRSNLHGSLVFSSPTKPIGRVWLADGQSYPMEVIRVIGNRFKFFYNNEGQLLDEISFDRQIRAFGKDIQKLLQKLRIGIVGLGGTGSAVAEQLMRLGVGDLRLFDGQAFEKSNVNRVYGSLLSDEGHHKTKIAERSAHSKGLGTKVITCETNITNQVAIKELRNCDLVFACTDDEWGRSLLNTLSIYYYIPVIDMAVLIDSQDGNIKSILGRVTTLFPSNACLLCRERLNSQSMLAESLQATNPTEAAVRRQEGYAPELAEPAPAVITFTSSVAAAAVSEMIQRLTGFMGARETNEYLYFFDRAKVITTTQKPQADCFCANKNNWGRGDTTPFLDTVWSQNV
ncbi:MAG: ThiF family adenylyltransferase [Patescibacteria group bacterium]|nr:ThiF family adenylyltransferase [Patescibacteria group bacterium]